MLIDQKDVRARSVFTAILIVMTVCSSDSDDAHPVVQEVPLPVQRLFSGTTSVSGIDYTNGLTDTVNSADVANIAAASSDYDKNSDLDWFVTNITRDQQAGCDAVSAISKIGNRHYRNLDGVFEDVIGARITITTGGASQLGEICIANHFAAQNPAVQTFGLRIAGQVDEPIIDFAHGVRHVTK